MSRAYEQKGLAVPSGRLARATRMGGLSARLVGSVAAGGVAALASGQRPKTRDLLLTPANARRLTDELARMRGAAMKMGQLLSMEASDLLPPELADILSKLRADAHYMPPAQLKKVLIANFGPDFLKRFKRFDVRPIAAASIGQVHKAETKDGQTLALKIQYPGVRGAIDADVSNLGALLKVSGLLPRGFEIAPFLEEARRQLHEEADYTREARQLDRFADLLAGDPAFTLPRSVPAHCTLDILAMDYIASQPIEALDETDQQTRDSACATLLRLFLRELFDFNVVQTDPNFANFRWQPETGRIVLLDFGAAREVTPELAARFRTLLHAGAEQDRVALRNAMTEIGYIRPETPETLQNMVLDMALKAAPFLTAETFDFADTSLLSSMREDGMALGQAGFREIPPFDALYLQRKLAGLVLLATRLKARVDMRAALAPYL